MRRHPIFFDSTVLTRVVLGGVGSSFAVELFFRAENGEEQLVTDTLAVVEAYHKAVVAVASSLTQLDSYDKVVERLREDEGLRRESTVKAFYLVDYIYSLAGRGHLVVVPVLLEDIREAVGLADENDIPLADAVHVAVALRMGVERIASFSPHVRRVAPSLGLKVLP